MGDLQPAGKNGAKFREHARTFCPHYFTTISPTAPRMEGVHLFWILARPERKAVAMSEQKIAHRRRLDRGLYISEGVMALGAAVFLVGFVIEKSSNTPGKALEAAGFVIFAIGLFAAGAYGYLLSQHFSRTASDPKTQIQIMTEGPRPHFSYLGSRMHQAVGDTTATLVREVQANPENDMSKARLIERERQGLEGIE